jgi:hypothetical protein
LSRDIGVARIVRVAENDDPLPVLKRRRTSCGWTEPGGKTNIFAKWYGANIPDLSSSAEAGQNCQAEESGESFDTESSISRK